MGLHISLEIIMCCEFFGNSRNVSDFFDIDKGDVSGDIGIVTKLLILNYGFHSSR